MSWLTGSRATFGVAAAVLTAGCASSGAHATGAGPNASATSDGNAPPAAAAVVLDSLRSILQRARTDSAFPAAYAIVGNRSGIVAEFGVGALDWKPSPPPDARTLWDLASLTKVVGMTSAVMQLVDAGRIDLDAPAQRYLPEWTGANKERVTIRHLLTHSSGLPAWRPLYKESSSAESAVAVVIATDLDTLPASRMVYSDLGAILLGKVVERVSGEALDAYLARRVFGPLGMRDTRYRPPVSERERIAPTEYDPWRQRHIRGEVHDENAFALGGVSGHAGLFSTARDLARFARMYLNGGTLDGARILSRETIERFTAVQNASLSHRALGWETPNGSNSAGRRMSSRAFGHTGFTGTSIWMDPANDVFVVLLTNRVNPTRQNPRIGAVRIALADAVLAALGNGAAAAPASAPSSSPSTRPPSPSR